MSSESKIIDIKSAEKNSKKADKKNSAMPVLPLRDVVVYPHMVIPLFVGREKSIKALEDALNDGRQVLLAAQKESTLETPTEADIYSFGTIANILQMLKLPDGTVKVLVEGSGRGRVVEYHQSEPFFKATVTPVETDVPDGIELERALRNLTGAFEQFVKLDKKFSSEIILSITTIENPVRLVDTIAAHLPLKIADKQKILEALHLVNRIELLLQMIEIEIDLLQVEKRVTTDVERRIKKNQREYYLHEKMKAIQKELGEITDEAGKLNEVDTLMKKINASGMSKEAKEKALNELNKLKMMPPMSAEATVCRNYIDWMLMVPWKYRSHVRKDLARAEAILNEEHYGLEKVKERILEYLAVHQRVKKIGGPILCLVGPPGVGKTSLGQSIARATGRKFVRMSLGGMRDEAEIRGHRRTYIGAMPGKILQKLAKTGVKNPLFLLDEVDKMSMDFRGDPASALLEVLDPEQNDSFNDHYLEVDYDLSEVMFVTTANSLNIPLPLLDRMEVIRLAGYTEDEKLNIAQRYLIPKQIKENGLEKSELSIDDAALLDIIRYYTREAGVRNLEREISKICRKVVKELLLAKSKSARKSESKSARKSASVSERKSKTKISSKNLEKYLGVRRYRFGQAGEHDQIGQVTGLAWTEVGGELLTIEAVAVPGKGKIISTGKLGEVMQESIQAALTVVRSRSKKLGIPIEFFEKNDIHIHVPEGATPKDGPSAGIAMCTAAVSMLTGIPVRRDVAMTGEITLRGQILPIGGLKEKLLAARRAGISDVIIPDENRRELAEIPEEVYKGMTLHPLRWIDEVLELSLIKMPEPILDEPPPPNLVPEERKTDDTRH